MHQMPEIYELAVARAGLALNGAVAISPVRDVSQRGRLNTFNGGVNI